MEWSLAAGVWVESRAAITPERTRRRKMSIRMIIALSAAIVLSTAATASVRPRNKKSSQRTTGSRYRPARGPTFRSLQSHQSLPSRSYRRWYPWLQSNARALLNYTAGRQGMRGGHSSRSFRLGNSKFASKRNQGPVTLPRDRRENEAFKQAWARRHEQHCLAAIEMLDH
jgi:hypothetical protein